MCNPHDGNKFTSANLQHETRELVRLPRTPDVALTDSISLARFHNEYFGLPIVVSENGGNLPAESAPRFGCSRVDIEEVYVAVVAFVGDTNVNGPTGVVLDEDSTHYPIAFVIRA